MGALHSEGKAIESINLIRSNMPRRANASSGGSGNFDDPLKQRDGTRSQTVFVSSFYVCNQPFVVISLTDTLVRFVMPLKHVPCPG
jgi:hypothetical protein